MEKQELRIGNTIYYETEHGDLITHTVDIDSLIWLSEDEKGFNLVHTPITLTEELLIERGFDLNSIINHAIKGNVVLSCFRGVWAFKHTGSELNHLHELENIYYDLTKKALTKINL